MVERGALRSARWRYCVRQRAAGLGQRIAGAGGDRADAADAAAPELRARRCRSDRHRDQARGEPAERAGQRAGADADRSSAQHQVASSDDYIKLLPSVSFQSFGPGQSQIYFRGITSGGDGLHIGSEPATGVYVDEVPLTTIANGVDLHVYDIARVEALSGPQGTLFGASSLSGTLRHHHQPARPDPLLAPASTPRSMASPTAAPGGAGRGLRQHPDQRQGGDPPGRRSTSTTAAISTTCR